MADEGFERKLAAILSADVEGYSRLMDDDEEATVRTLTTYRTAFSDLVQQFRGRVVDSTGDNILAEFKSVVDAVNCAVEIQRELAERNAELSDHRKMQFRIGVNLGDVIDEDGRIYGDGVNIAARVESLADAGGICISGRAHDQVENKLGLEYEDLGKHEVKNISRPIQVYRVLSYPGAAAHRVVQAKETLGRRWRKIGFAVAVIVIVFVALGIWQLYIRRPTIDPASIEKMAFPLPEKPSIAILPFDNLSGDKSQEYIADGLSENIISALSKIPDMVVIARNSTFVYKAKAVKVNRVAEELGVKYVLEGSVQRSGDSMRVTAQLIDAVKGHHLWSERYDRATKDFFTVQDDITRNIVIALQVELTEGEQARIWHSTKNLEAWGYVTKGIALFDKYTKEKNVKARELFNQAVELDPNYASAWIFLAWTHFIDFRFGFSKSRGDSLKRCIEITQKVAILDDSLPDVHSVWNSVYLAQGQYEKAIAEGKKAIDLGPSNSINHMLLAMTLHFAGMFEESIFYNKTAMRLDPYYGNWYLGLLADSYSMAEEYEKAIEPLKKTIERAKEEGSQLIPIQLYLVNTHVGLGQMEEAKTLAAEILELDPNFSLKNWKKSRFYKDPKDLDRLLTALRKAGLPDEPPLPLPDKPSIAVLAFDNLSGDPEQEYFSDGIAENIITALSKVGELFVIARNSSFTYKGKPVKDQQVGRELGVRYVLEGSVQRSGEKVRITAQLIDAKNGQHLWAEKYDRDFKDIFEIQDEITMKIVTALQVNLTAGEQARVWSKETKNLEVYLKSIKAYSLMKEGKKESFIQYGQLAQEIIDMEPESPLGYRMLGWYHFDRYMEDKSRQESYLIAFDMAQKALSLNESDAYSLALFGWLYRAMKIWDKAIAMGMRSVELEPNGAYLHCLLGNTLMRACRYDEAFIHLKQAIRLNPFPAYFYYQYLGMCYFHKGQPQKALSEYKKALQLSSNDYALHGNLAVTYITLGRVEEARASMEKSMELAPQSSIGWVSRNWPFKCRDNLQRFLDAMRKAGFPE